MSRAIDALIAARLIKLLVTPFKKTNAYKMVNVGVDMTLYPSNSFVEFRDGRDDASDP